MKKRIFIIIFVFWLLAQKSYSFNKNFENDIFENKEYVYILSEKNNFTKKDLKQEIKKRKKYHKILLEKYNKNFEKKYFDLISENSSVLSNLRKELKK